MEWICWLFPACIAVIIIDKRKKTGEFVQSPVREIWSWGSWVVVINGITLFFIMYCLGQEGIMAEAFSSLPFALKYLFIASIVAIIMPYIVEIVKKYINISVEIEKVKDR